MRKIVLSCMLALSSLAGIAQNEDVSSRLYIGATGGVRVNFMRFSELNKKLYPNKDAQTGGVFSVFVEYEFGKDLHFAIRPELDFVRRGGSLSNIKSNLLGAGVSDQVYKVAVNYWDFRIPVIYNFMESNSRFRPYVYVAPVLGFPSGGNISLKGVGADKTDRQYKIDATKANVASSYFGLGVGGGVKYYFPLAGNYGYVGVEAVYERGLTDTYSSKEKKHQAQVNNTMFSDDYVVNGTRKFSGLEFKLTVGVPISVFSHKKTEPGIVEEEPVTTPVENKQELDNPCCSLDEIINLMARGEDVKGKVICSIDDINFDFNKSEIKEGSYEYLDKLAATLVRMNSRIEVKGHTDNIGPDEVNMRISRQRAKAVMDYLVNHGVDKNKITYSYYGATQPLTSNETLQGRRMNRRVEIEILK